MKYKSYIMRIVTHKGYLDANKHCPDDESAMDLAGRMIKMHHGCTAIKVYRMDDTDRHEVKNFIGEIKR